MYILSLVHLFSRSRKRIIAFDLKDTREKFRTSIESLNRESFSRDT